MATRQLVLTEMQLTQILAKFEPAVRIALRATLKLELKYPSYPYVDAIDRSGLALVARVIDSPALLLTDPAPYERLILADGRSLRSAILEHPSALPGKPLSREAVIEQLVALAEARKA
ncbi:MAG: hypothetical protein ACYDA1_07190 [Vulcanimicrobiaceae bacterium]